MGTPQRHADASPQTIEALQASEARYRDLFENSNDAMTTVTRDGIFMSVNRAFEALLDRSREELIGHHYSMVAAPVSLVQWDEHIRRALAGERLPGIFEPEIMRKDGSVVPICQMMEGEITVACTLGVGSIFTIRLPAQAVAPRATAGVGPGNVEIEEELDGEDPAS